MARPAVKLRCALDTNFLLNLAKDLGPAHLLREILQESGNVLVISPTVNEELGYGSSKEENPSVRELYRIAQRSLVSWGILPFDFIDPCRKGIAKEFARALIRKGFLPDEEENDGLILAETSLAKIPRLITSDAHLTSIPSEFLPNLLGDFDLDPVQVVSPAKLWEVYKKLR